MAPSIRAPQRAATAPKLSGEATSGAESALLDRFQATRALTQALTASLSAEDLNLQSLPEASPGKWHLAHTSWFFDTFLLERFARDYRPFRPAFRDLFNSYYDAVGPQLPRHERALSRPALAEVIAYRLWVDAQVPAAFAALQASERPEALELLRLGIQHEQQHQELLLTDLKHALFSNPLRPSFGASPLPSGPAAPPLRFLEQPESLSWLGATSGAAFAFDNERPRHRVFLEAHALASRLVTNGEYLAFVEAGGYATPDLWLSDGYATVRREGLAAPLYWQRRGPDWSTYTLAGDRPLDPSAPVCHVSYYEADAYARWAGARLPTEAEWEQAAEREPVQGNFLDDGKLSPLPASGATAHQLFGDCWEWTQSAYLPYPRYRAPAGALGEYNAKFMVNQMVLRGGSAFSPRDHLRASYRNFFPPQTRFQLSGIRLAKDLG